LARYNSKRIYNRLIPNGGARYNSAPFSINIFDYSNVIIDNIKNVTRNTSIQDSNTTRTESITFGFNVNIYDDIVILEKTVLLIDTGTRIDLGHGQETINNQSNSNYSDTGRGNDNINLSPLMLLLNELSKHTDNINIHPLTIALSQILNINETINFDTVLLEFIDNINSSENTLFDSNINIEDNSQGSDNLSQIISNILTNELGNGVEVINLLPLSINITDNNLTANETVNINSVIIYNDSGNGIDSVTYRLGTFYNTKLSYNKGYNKGGANYNTSKQFVIMLFERGMMAIEAKVTPDKISMEDSSIGNDTMLPISSMSPISELINVQEGFVLFPHMITIDESGHISISTDIRLSVSFNDSSISTVDSTLLDVDVNALDEIAGIFQDILSLPLMQVNTSDNISMADLINIAFSDINLIDNILINELANISNDIFLNDENISAIDIVVYRSGVFYNTKLQYNKGINKGGSIYNSSKHLIIVVSEIGSIDEKEVYAVQACFVNDTGQGSDNSNITNEIPKLFDSGSSTDSFKNIVNNVTVIDLSKLDFQEETMFARLVDVIDKIIANDYVRKAETHFIVDSDNILQPLGIKVAKVSEGILPFTKDYTEEIPGMHGEYYLKSELKGKAIEFEVVTPDGLTPEVKSKLKEKFMQYLNPTKNEEKPLTFSDDLEKQYLVRYSGNIDIDNYPSWFKFVIPFKMSNPIIRGSFDNILIGSGTITNEGNTNANMIININGLADNPTIEIDGQTLIYNGTIEYGQTVVIDTEKKTVMMGDINVLNNWCGIFPTLKPGETNVTMNGNISIRWRDAWL
jgi:predicted phage tail component-like protein